jgi:hypothetical protein
MKITIVDAVRQLPSGVVTTLHWRATKVEDNYVASAYSEINVPTKDPSDPTFIPFEQLTESEVINWVLTAMGEEKVSALEANLVAQIEAQKNPVSATGVPWNE